MANHKSAEKRARQNEKRRRRNAAVKSALRTATKKLVAAVEAGQVDEAEKLLNPVCRLWDKGVSKNVIHKNTAARKKSRLCKKVSDLKAGTYQPQAKAKRRKASARRTKAAKTGGKKK